MIQTIMGTVTTVPCADGPSVDQSKSPLKKLDYKHSYHKMPQILVRIMNITEKYSSSRENH